MQRQVNWTLFTRILKKTTNKQISHNLRTWPLFSLLEHSAPIRNLDGQGLDNLTQARYSSSDPKFFWYRRIKLSDLVQVQEKIYFFEGPSQESFSRKCFWLLLSRHYWHIWPSWPSSCISISSTWSVLKKEISSLTKRISTNSPPWQVTKVYSDKDVQRQKLFNEKAIGILFLGPTNTTGTSKM